MTQKETRMIKDVQLTLVSDVSMSQYDCGHSRNGLLPQGAHESCSSLYEVAIWARQVPVKWFINGSDSSSHIMLLVWRGHSRGLALPQEGPGSLVAWFPWLTFGCMTRKPPNSWRSWRPDEVRVGLADPLPHGCFPRELRVMCEGRQRRNRACVAQACRQSSLGMLEGVPIHLGRCWNERGWAWRCWSGLDMTALLQIIKTRWASR